MEQQGKLPLEGIKVVELANYVAAPIVGRICADLGATVIKIEGRGGDAWRDTCAGYTETGHEENPLFDVFNAGKKSLSLNLKTPGGKEVFFKLLEEADVLLTNTRYQSLVKLGIDYESIKDRFPRLIYATITGYGYNGPDCNAPGFDNIAFWSRTGFSIDMSVDAPGSYPVNSRFGMGDIVTGSMLFGGLMTALYRRECTGRGDFATISLYDAGIWMFGGCITLAQEPYLHHYPEPRNSGTPTNLPYKCADGEWVRCTIFEFERYAPKFFEALGVTEEMKALEVSDMAAMNHKAGVVVPVFEKGFLKKTSAEWLQTFRELDIVCGKLNHFKDVLEDEQAWANDYLQKHVCSNGTERVLPSCPVRLASSGVPPVGGPVLYAQDNEEILTGLGYSEADIERMTKDGDLS